MFEFKIEFLKQKFYILFVISFCFMGVLYSISSFGETTTEQQDTIVTPPVPRPSPQRNSESGKKITLENIYPPRVPKFSKNRQASLIYTNLQWLNMDVIQQANYIHGVYEKLLEARDLDYSPRVLTCKAFRESVYTYKGRKIFQTQKQTSVKNSTASGISQVTISTSQDMFNRKIPPKMAPSVVQGFEDIRDGKKFHDKMAGNMIAQMELGVVILRAKQMDTRAKQIKTLLKHYYGHPNKKINSCYANRILQCAFCIKKNKAISEKCLDKALAGRGGC